MKNQEDWGAEDHGYEEEVGYEAEDGLQAAKNGTGED